MINLINFFDEIKNYGFRVALNNLVVLIFTRILKIKRLRITYK